MTVIAGRYELGRVLGSGAMSDVRLARDLVLGRQVAVKLFRPSVEPARVRQEVRLHARLSHPGLVAVYDSGTDDRGTFLVLQLVDGPTLAERISRSPLTAAEAARVGAALAEVLAHLHANGVVHRDVKPANVLLGPDGAPRLADLGIAQEQGQDGLTATGFTLGTVPYLSPEQVRGRSATPASDVYALGLVLLEAVTGRREYPGMTAEGALARLTRPPVVDAHLAGAWPGLLTAMTADDPAARPTAAEVAAVLRGLAAVPPPVRATTPVLDVPTQLLPAARHGHHGRRAVVATSVLLLGLGGLLAAGRADGPTRTPSTVPEPAVRPVAVQPVPATTAPRVVPVASRPVPAVSRTAAVEQREVRKGKPVDKGGGPGKRRAG